MPFDSPSRAFGLHGGSVDIMSPLEDFINIPFNWSISRCSALFASSSAFWFDPDFLDRSGGRPPFFRLFLSDIYSEGMNRHLEGL